MSRFILFLLPLSGCTSTKSTDSDSALADTAVEACPVTLEEFCLREFGGECPSFDEAAAMHCDGAHFSPSGSTDPLVDSDGYETCPNPKVSCYVEEDHGGPYVTLWYNADLSGRLEGVTVKLPDTDECPGSQSFGDLWC